MLLFNYKEKGHLSSKSVLLSLFRYGLRFMWHYNPFCNAGLRPYSLFAPRYRERCGFFAVIRLLEFQPSTCECPPLVSVLRLSPAAVQSAGSAVEPLSAE